MQDNWKIEDLSESVREAYIDSTFFQSPNFPNDILTVHTAEPATATNLIPGVVTEVFENHALAKTFTSVQVRWTPTQSFERIRDARGAVKGSLQSGVTETLAIAGSDPLSFNSCWVVDKDWKQIMFFIFSITKIIMNIVIVFITFARPFMPEWRRLRAAWVGQTVIYYQLMVYSGLLPGMFGYTIDMGQEGMIKSSRKYAFLRSNPKIDDDLDFVVYKFIQNDMVPKILEEVLIETISIVTITIIVLILKIKKRGVRETKLLRMAREIKSSIYIFSAVPFSVHFCHHLLSLSYSKD